MTPHPSTLETAPVIRLKAAVWPSLKRWSIVTVIVLPLIAWLSFASGQSVPSIIRSLPLGLVLSATIGGLAWTVFPLAAMLAAGWHRAAAWAFYIATMAFCAVAGTAAAATVPYLVGVLDARDISVLFLENIAGTIPVTIVIGITMILVGSARARLEATELSLRTQQLERERAEKLAAEAQLASLSSRVQPHFLFNTLNSISGLIREQPAKAEAMIEHLSSLLRSSLDGQEVVTIDQELKLVTDYLQIQCLRLGSRVRYQLDVPADTAGTIPPFSLQTLVENSVKHVAGQRAEGVSIRIAARREAARVVIEVSDDGPGFDPDAMRAGHGLDVLQRRLRGVFGDAASMEFDRRPRAMTVRLRAPIS
jgi:two-component system, LytTR family, sensor histidine kinase AlgZ